MYTAAVLNKNSVDVLKKIVVENLNLQGFVFETKQGEPLPHHMTINLGTFDAKINNQELVNKPTFLHIDSIFYCEKIGTCAANVIKCECENQNVNSINKHKHITICIKPPAKPFDSNKLFESKSNVFKFKPIVLEAVLKEVK